jgi:hypothetical protein
MQDRAELKQTQVHTTAQTKLPASSSSGNAVLPSSSGMTAVTRQKNMHAVPLNTPAAG